VRGGVAILFREEKGREIPNNKPKEEGIPKVFCQREDICLNEVGKEGRRPFHRQEKSQTQCGDKQRLVLSPKVEENASDSPPYTQG